MSGPFGFVRRLTTAIVNVPARPLGLDPIVDSVDEATEEVTDVLDEGVVDVLGEILG